jgi:hypothetical protein
MPKSQSIVLKVDSSDFHDELRIGDMKDLHQGTSSLHHRCHLNDTTTASSSEQRNSNMQNRWTHPNKTDHQSLVGKNHHS